MKKSGLRKTSLLALVAAGLIGQAAAREYVSRAPSPAPLQTQALKGEPAPGRVAVEAMERLASLPELPGNAGQAGSRITFYLSGFSSGAGGLSPADDAALAEMVSWQLQILDKEGRKVHFIQGLGSPASPVLGWDGLTAAGESLPGGFYSARLVWQNREGGVYYSGKAGFSLFSQLETRKFSRLNLPLGFLDKFDII
jgi:hypothetical protein